MPPTAHPNAMPFLWGHDGKNLIVGLARKVHYEAIAVVGWYGTAVPSLLSAEEPNKPGDTKQITNSIGMKLTLVPSGEFKMGSGESAETAATFFKKTYAYFPPFTPYELKASFFFDDEYPQHRVRITKPFLPERWSHVTRGQFRQFVKDTGYISSRKKEKPLKMRISS